MQTQPEQTTIEKMLTTNPPAFTGPEAAAIACDHFGIRAKAAPQVSERDQNFRLDAEDGRRYMFKIANQAEQEAVVDFQNRALVHLAAKDPSLPVPRVIPTLGGRLHCRVERGGHSHFVRVMSWLDGVLLDDVVADAALAGKLGSLLARLGLALEDFEHPASNPPLLWDMKRAGGLAALLDSVESTELRQAARAVLERFTNRVKPVLDGLRAQVIHNDMNLGNVLMDEHQPGRINGLIDFGDLVKSPLIIDLAVAAAYQLSEEGDPLASALPMIAAYHAVRPLLPGETALLKDLIETRLITSLLIGSYRAKLFPENRDYLLISQNAVSSALLRMVRLDAAGVVERIRAVCP